MTSPGPDDYTRRLSAAASAAGVNNPQLASALAGSDLDDTEMRAVGGFANSLNLVVARRLAANSGAMTNFSADERNALFGAGEQLPEEERVNDSRSFLERAVDKAAGALSDTGNFLLKNPATGKVLDGFEWLGNVGKLPFRVASDAVDAKNNDEITSQMQAAGYDPDSQASYLAFMFSKGDSLYHDLAGVRDVFGDEDVDLAIRMQADPERFYRELTEMDPTEAARIQAQMETAEFQDAFDAVDRKHISPGRDLARLLLPQGDPREGGLWTEDGELFTAISGAADAAYLWFTDPTLILGRAAHAVRAVDALGRRGTLMEKALDRVPILKARARGLQSMTDAAGIEALLRVDPRTGEAATKVGRGWERFLKDAAELRKADKMGDEAKRAGIYAVMSQRYGALMPLLDEINGARVIADAGATSGYRLDRLTKADLVTTTQKPIETLEELSAHLISTNGLLRLTNGMATREAIVMPGVLSWRAERTAASEARTIFGRNKAAKTSRWIDYSQPNRFLPNEAESALMHATTGLTDAAREGLAQSRLMNQNAVLQLAKLNARTARAKWERVARRFQTQIPGVEAIDLTDSNSTKVVEQFARMYLNRGDAAKLASAYALGDMAARRAVVRGMLQQSFHASGLSRSEAGRAFMQRYIADTEDLAKQKYGYGESSKIQTDRGTVEAALYLDQISPRVIVPSFREMNYLATKFAVSGWAHKRAMGHFRAIAQGPGTDSLMGAIKLGWITTAAGGLRNALDEIANFAAYGMTGDVLAARVAYTKATKALREERRAASKERMRMISVMGREAADDRIAFQLGQGLKSHETAKLELEKAKRAEQALADVPRKLNQRVTDAEADLVNAKEVRFRALAEFESAKRNPGLPKEELDTYRERAQWASDEVVRVQNAIKQHRKEAGRPEKHIDAVKQKFDDRGVKSVDDAAADLKAAEAELKQANLLSRAISHKLPYAFRYVADNVNDALIGAVLGKAMSVFGKDWAITGDRVKWAQELTDAELTSTLQQGVFQTHYADLILDDRHAMDLHRNGLMARKYAFRPTGWGEIEADGGLGMDSLAKVLQLRFADESSPAHSWVQTVAALARRKGDEGKILRVEGESVPSSTMSREDWQEVFDAARESVRRRIDEEDLRHFVEQAEIFRWYKGAKVHADDEHVLALAKDEYADRVSLDLAEALSAREGGLSLPLIDELAAGRVPDRSWLAQLPREQRPAKAIGQLWAPYNPAHEPGGYPRGYTQMLSKAYDKVVTDQINALSRNPLVTALYMRARENTQGYVKHLVDNGWDAEIAEDMGRRVAIRHAEAEALKHIDNPHVSSQFSLLNRNLFAFVRAQEDWLRRWGRTIKDNPELIRKAQLLIHGGTGAGFLEQDDQGELHFVYPGSPLMLGVLNKVGAIFGQDNLARLPVTGELSSQVMFLNPSLDNPVGLSGMPLLSMPFRALSALMGPDHALLNSSMDKVVNGELGAGREWWEAIFPSFVNRIIGSVVNTGDNSRLVQAQMSTIANLEAAGALDNPELQTESGKAKLLHALNVGTKNDLIMSTLLGFFAPASPSYEGKVDETTEGFQGNKADWSAHIMGIRSLKDEAREVFSRLPYEEAMLWWTTVHPNESVLAPMGAGSRTDVGAKSASAPATVAAASYIESNLPFFGEYGSTAAYLIPQGKPGTKNGEYSDVAWRAQLEMGIRDYKSVNDYFDDVITSRGNATYFAEKDKFDEALASAGGSESRRRQVEQEWAQKKAEIYAVNPLLAARHAESAIGNSQIGGVRQELYRMVGDARPMTVKALGVNRTGIAMLLAAQERYEQGTALLEGRRGTSANRQRAGYKATYENEIKAVVEQFPGLGDLARGVFRLPN